ncbi:MAG: hypothetical protein HYY06_04355 [Deltaproteobacteria bacterium]|nr:hypothetical protein [Deltaproteobacteria bacterium]
MIHVRWWPLSIGLTLGACGARSTASTSGGAGEGPDADTLADGSVEVDAGPWVPGTEGRLCCQTGPELKVTAGRDQSTGAECGVALAVDLLIENCGSEPVESAVPVQLIVGGSRDDEGRVLQERWTEPGMPPGMGQWLPFVVSAEDWAAAVEEFSESGFHYRAVANRQGKVEECYLANNGALLTGPCL